MDVSTIAETQAGDAGGGGSPTPASGDVLRGRFELREIIGRGGGSLVFRARDRIRALAGAHETEVAVKVVTAQGELRSELVALVHREACYLHELAHPNIVRGFGSDCDGDRHFLVMELLRGSSLTNVLRNARERRLPCRFAARVIRETANALTHAHSRGLLHGDLKPSNVFVTREGDVKILDFGASRRLDAGEATLRIAPEMDDLSALTPSYASLEMFFGEPPTESDDVFSLAVLAYVMLTGRHPFGGKSAADVRFDRSQLQSRPREISRTQWSALQRGLAIERCDRTAGVAEFAQGFLRTTFLERLLG
jgi:serine/threonine protein kinase